MLKKKQFAPRSRFSPERLDPILKGVYSPKMQEETTRVVPVVNMTYSQSLYLKH